MYCHLDENLLMTDDIRDLWMITDGPMTDG